MNRRTLYTLALVLALAALLSQLLMVVLDLRAPWRLVPPAAITIALLSIKDRLFGRHQGQLQ